ncbi:MAG: type II toxin-antitoxin system VapC family toxin [Methylococcales bacterium]|nr:MAG: type II toxin-antitoxin system VapC family toxin [Methylococcales bacterium]
MNGVKFLLDTNVIIGMYHKSTEVKALLHDRQVIINQCAYSAITRMELLGFPSITDIEQQAIKTLLNKMVSIAITEDIEVTTIKFKQRHRVKLPDAIIVATAITYNLELLTLDKDLSSKR